VDNIYKNGVVETFHSTAQAIQNPFYHIDVVHTVQYSLYFAQSVWMQIYSVVAWLGRP
jgi:hypothetical protein